MTIPKGATHEFVVDFGHDVRIFLKLENGNLYKFHYLSGWTEFYPHRSVVSLLSSPKVRKLNSTIELFVYEDST